MPSFVIKHKDHKLVLDLLFLILIKFSEKYKPNDIFNIIIYLWTY